MRMEIRLELEVDRFGARHRWVWRYVWRLKELGVELGGGEGLDFGLMTGEALLSLD